MLEKGICFTGRLWVKDVIYLQPELDENRIEQESSNAKCSLELKYKDVLKHIYLFFHEKLQKQPKRNLLEDFL